MNTLVVPNFNRKESRFLTNSSTQSCVTGKDTSCSNCSYSSNKNSLPSITIKSPTGEVVKNKNPLSYIRTPHRRLKSFKKLESIEINSSLYSKTVKVPIKEYHDLIGYSGSTGAFRKLTVNTNSHKHFTLDDGTPNSAILPMSLSNQSNSPIKRYNSLASIKIQRFSPLKSPRKKMSTQRLWDRLEQAIESEKVSVSQQKAYLKNLYHLKRYN